MRKTTSLAGALLLCACNASPKPDGPVLAKAGLWRIEGTVISMEGLPPGEPKPADLGHTKTSDKCFKGGKMPDAIWADGDNPPSDVKIEGNHFTAQSSGVETDEPTNQQIGMTLHIEGTFDPTHYDVTAMMTDDFGAKAPHVTIRSHTVAHYVGPCPPEPQTDDNDSMTAPASADAATNAT